jgi:hypothetical protein
MYSRTSHMTCFLFTVEISVSWMVAWFPAMCQDIRVCYIFYVFYIFIQCLSYTGIIVYEYMLRCVC